MSEPFFRLLSWILLCVNWMLQMILLFIHAQAHTQYPEFCTPSSLESGTRNTKYGTRSISWGGHTLLPMWVQFGISRYYISEEKSFKYPLPGFFFLYCCPRMHCYRHYYICPLDWENNGMKFYLFNRAKVEMDFGLFSLLHKAFKGEPLWIKSVDSDKVPPGYPLLSTWVLETPMD